MSPVIRECVARGVDFFVLHTGQHYSYGMDGVFFEQLGLPEARHNLEVGSGGHGEQTGRMLMGVEKVLEEERPDVVLVEGDTNTVLAGALAAYKLGVRVGHVEAGLRSYDRRMPEEIRVKAIRRRVLYGALDGVERGILYLCTRVVDKVSSPVLGVQLVEIVSRLREAMKRAFTRHVESYGFKRVVQLVEQAKAMGCKRTSEWLHDMNFIKYLTFLNLNQPIGYI